MSCVPRASFSGSMHIRALSEPGGASDVPPSPLLIARSTSPHCLQIGEIQQKKEENENSSATFQLDRRRFRAYDSLPWWPKVSSLCEEEGEREEQRGTHTQTHTETHTQTHDGTPITHKAAPLPLTPRPSFLDIAAERKVNTFF